LRCRDNGNIQCHCEVMKLVGYITQLQSSILIHIDRTESFDVVLDDHDDFPSGTRDLFHHSLDVCNTHIHIAMITDFNIDLIHCVRMLDTKSTCHQYVHCVLGTISLDLCTSTVDTENTRDRLPDIVLLRHHQNGGTL